MIKLIYGICIILGVIGYLIFWQRKAKSKNTQSKDFEGQTIIKSGAANHFYNGESVGGRLTLTNQQLVFISHNMNINNHTLKIAITDIAQVAKRKTAGFIPNGLAVTTKAGTEDRFVIFGGGKWVKAIDLLISKGQE